MSLWCYSVAVESFGSCLGLVLNSVCSLCVCVVMQTLACHATGTKVRGWCSGAGLPFCLVRQGLLTPTGISYALSSHLTIGVLGLQMHGTTSGFGSGGVKHGY